MFQIKQMTPEIKSRPIGSIITKNWERKRAIGRTKVLYSLRNRETNIQKCHSKEDITTHKRIKGILCLSSMFLKESVYK